jgi:hypothetical protein
VGQLRIRKWCQRRTRRFNNRTRCCASKLSCFAHFFDTAEPGVSRSWYEAQFSVPSLWLRISFISCACVTELYHQNQIWQSVCMKCASHGVRQIEYVDPSIMPVSGFDPCFSRMLSTAPTQAAQHKLGWTLRTMEGHVEPTQTAARATRHSGSTCRYRQAHTRANVFVAYR